MISLRPATMLDASFLLELKNDSVMRKFAVVTRARIKQKDHLIWLSKHLGEIRIATQNERIGMIRITKGNEVSINLHPKFRGKGLGSQVLKYCPKGVWAKIVDGNVASMRLFLQNGFQIIDHEKSYYVLTN